jgi:hypothetical protein
MSKFRILSIHLLPGSQTGIFFFFIHVGCPGQLTRTTTIPHGPLDILQAQEQVRHRGGDRRAHKGSNPEEGAEQVHNGPQQLDPQVLGTHESSNQDTQTGESLVISCASFLQITVNNMTVAY